MKKLVILVAAVSISSVVGFAQDTIMHYQPLTQSQNKLLDHYGIDYVSPQTRIIVETGKLNTLTDSVKKEITASFQKFEKWNLGYFDPISDTIGGNEYFAEVNDNSNNVKSIRIVEHYTSSNSVLKDGSKLYFGNYGFSVYVSDFSGNVTDFFYSDRDLDLDCPQCYVY
jgi:hypothetical protein